MEDVYSDLINLDYKGLALDVTVYQKALNKGPPNLYFVDIITWLSSQLVPLCSLESSLTSVNEENIEGALLGFLVEVSSLLKELCCPIKQLTTGSVSDRLQNPTDKILLIIFLIQELQAGKILGKIKPKKEPALQIELNESQTAKDLRETLVPLGFGRPPDNLSPQKLFTELEKKLYSASQPFSPKDQVGEILFSGYLTEKQWFQLEKLYNEIYQEYKIRRNLLLTRLDVTIQSFLWANNKSKDKAEDIFMKCRNLINDCPSVKLSDVLSSTTDLIVIEKTNNASVRKNTKSSVNIHIIGDVPDRGGRPEEQQPPPPEVPSWQKTDNSRQHSSNNYRNTGDRGSFQHRRDENINRNSYDNSQKRNNYNSNTDNVSRSTGNMPTNQPFYQPVHYGTQLINPQFGLSGYMPPAGDNFHQYGMGPGVNQYQPNPNAGYRPRSRGGYNERGSRSFHGRGRK